MTWAGAGAWRTADWPVRVAMLVAAVMFLSLPVFAWPQDDAAPGAACGRPDSGCFQLNAVSLEGLTVYKPGELAALYQGYLTREVSTADLVDIATAITDRYRADGYFLSRAVVPPQAPGTGVARIRIYEGYISEVALTGIGAPAASPYLKGLSELRPLRLAELERRLSLAGDEPGVQIKTQLEPVLDDPARHRLVAVAGLKPLAVSTYVDNRGPKTSGPWQAYGRVAKNSAIRPGDQLALAVLAVPNDPRAFTYGEVSYSAPLGGGARLRGTIGMARARDGANTLSTDVGSESLSASVSYLKPLKRDRRVNAWTQATLQARHIEQDWTDTGGYADNVVVLRGALNADVTTPGKSSNLFAQVSAGQRGQPGVKPNEGLSRADASRQFVKVNVHGSHYRDLGPWAGLFVTADGQWSPHRLLSSEEFVVGGAPYGRGYNYAEIGGDQGVAASAELRAGFSPRRGPFSFLQGYSFLDAGKVWNLKRSGGDADLVSTGLGVRARVGDRATLTVEAARPLTRTPYDRRKKTWRPFFALSTRF